MFDLCVFFSFYTLLCSLIKGKGWHCTIEQPSNNIPSKHLMNMKYSLHRFLICINISSTQNMCTCIRARIMKRTRHNNDVVDVTSIMANNYLASAVRNSFEIGNSEVVWRMTSWIQATVCRLHQTLVNVIHLIKSSKLSRDEWDGREHIENGKKHSLYDDLQWRKTINCTFIHWA